MIGSSENRISYNGNGIATEFAYNFIIIEKSDIKVLHVAADGTEQLLTKDYYVDMEKSVVLYPGYAPGAEIPEQDRPPVLPVGERLVIYREVPITQASALDKHWPFNVIENGLDKLTIICQQIWDRLQRSFYVSESTSTNFDPKVPIEAGKTFRVKDDGTGFEVTEDPGKVIDGATALLKQTTEQAVSANEAATNAQNAADTAERFASVVTYITPQMFKDYDGDDWTLAIQRALDAANGGTVYIPNGTYIISQPLYYYTGFLKGESQTDTIIMASNNFVNSNKHNIDSGNESSMIYLLNKNYVSEETDDTPQHARISNIEINCASVVDHGIMFPVDASRARFSNLMVKYSKISAYCNKSNLWLCTFDNCYSYYGNIGFDFSVGDITSLNFRQCYVIESQIAYKLTGSYMYLENCCADQIYDAVYLLIRFNGTIISPGSESTNANTIFDAYYSTFNVLGGKLFNIEKENSCIFKLKYGNKITVQNVSVFGNSPNCRLLSFESGRDNCLTLVNVPITNEQFATSELSIEPSNHLVVIDGDKNISTRSSYIPFIGNDAKNNIPSENESAIFFGSLQNPLQMASGYNGGRSFLPRVNLGDIILSKAPKVIGGIGWIVDYDASVSHKLNGVVSFVDGTSIVMSEKVSLDVTSINGSNIRPNCELYTNKGTVGIVYYVALNGKTIKLKDTAQNVELNDEIFVREMNNASNISGSIIPIINHGSTWERPTVYATGGCFFDEEINKPIWWNGASWVDANGAAV